MSKQSVPSKRLFVNDIDDIDVHQTPSPAKKVQTGFLEYQPQANGNFAPTVQNAQPDSAPQSVPVPSGPASSTSSASRKQISCGECRRLKLKCDRVFPCKACVKRGCADICPDGSLVSGKGSRYVLASTERLHEKISALVERVRELENALETLHEEHHNCSEYARNFPPSPHPLLSQEKLFIKSTMDLHSEGTLGRVPLTRKDRQRKGETKAQAGSVSPQNTPANVNTNSASSTPPLAPPPPSNLSPELFLPKPSMNANGQVVVSPGPRELELNLITNVVNSGFFPVLSAAFVEAHDRILPLREHNQTALRSNFYLVLERELPSREEADSLLSLMESTGTFLMIHMLTRRDFTLILESCYARLDPYHGMLKFALFFIVCAMGYQIDAASVDEERDVKMAKRYFSLSRIALVKFTFDRVSPGSPDADDLLGIVKCLYLLGTYLTFFSWQKEDELEASRIIDLLQMAVKILDLDSDRAHQFYTAAIANERRLMCYAIMSMIGKFSLTSGKMIPGMPRVTSRPPSCANDIDRFPSALEASYHQARDKFLTTCIVPIFDMLRSPSTRYEEILELDSTMRDFPFPAELTQEFGEIHESFPAPDSPLEGRGPLPKEILRFCTVANIHTTLLHLHRPFFQTCLRQRTSVLNGPHLISVFATMRSACILIRKLDAMEKAYPRFMSKATISWYHAFCAASALYISIERIPYCSLSPFNVRELNRAVQVFSRSNSPFARHTLPMIRQFAVRSAEHLSRWQAVLLEELGSDHSQEKASYCKQRFQAIRERAEAARDAVDHRAPSHGHLGTKSSTAVSSIREQNPVFDQDVYRGLDCWDHVHPDVLDIVLTLPTCSMEPEDNAELALADILSPTNRVLDLPPHSHGSRSRQSSSGLNFTPSVSAGSSGSGSLAEIFDRLDASLSRRTNLENPCHVSRSRSQSPSNPFASSQEMRALNIDELLKNDLDIDWAALTDVLISAPQTFEQSAFIN